MAATSSGYGHKTGAYGGYGVNLTGYGDPYHVTGSMVEQPAGGVVPDDGGVIVKLSGGFPVLGPYTVTIGGKICRAGVPGRAGNCYTNSAKTRLQFVQPHLAPGTYDIALSWPGGSEAIAGAITVVRRHRAGGIYMLRSMLPPGRAVRAGLVEDEQLLIGPEELP